MRKLKNLIRTLELDEDDREDLESHLAIVREKVKRAYPEMSPPKEVNGRLENMKTLLSQSGEVAKEALSVVKILIELLPSAT